MAIWQLGFYLIPNEKIEYELPFRQLLDESLLEWQEERIDKESQKKLSRYLPIEKSWSESIIQYGNLEKTCIEVSIDTITIRIRLDLARITNSIFEAVLNFIIENKCALYRIETNDCYDGTRKGLIQLITDSRLFLIMRKSNKFLEKLYAENAI